MNKYKETFGVDISKDVFDVHGSICGHNQFKNDEKGFASFLKAIPKESLVVMKATGLPLQTCSVSFQKQCGGIGGKSFICKTLYPDEVG